MIIYQDDLCFLEVDGFDETPRPMVLTCTCRRCGLTLHQRTLDVTRNTDPDRIKRWAMQDAQRALKHVCLAR